MIVRPTQGPATSSLVPPKEPMKDTRYVISIALSTKPYVDKKIIPTTFSYHKTSALKNFNKITSPDIDSSKYMSDESYVVLSAKHYKYQSFIP